VTFTRRTKGLACAALAAAAAGLFALARHGERATHVPTAPIATETTASEVRTAQPAVVATAELAHSTPNAPAGAGSAPTPQTMDEPALMTLLRSANGNDPVFAAELAREGNRRFPESADAPERSSILIHALAELGRASEARGEAERMVNHYPDSSWVRDVETFTGAHRHRNVVLDDQGRLRFVDPPPS
jgi:hypothetical protein